MKDFNIESCHRVAEMQEAFVDVSLGHRRYVMDAFSLVWLDKEDKMIESVRNLNKFEKVLWMVSVILVAGAFILSGNGAWLTLAASLVGVTALIFVAKGDVLGQILTIGFSILYALISFQFQYWGEMITYLGMTAPIALMSVVTWLKNPYDDKEVKVEHLKPGTWLVLSVATILVTILFYFVLDWFETPNLLFSTISIATSFLASSLMMLRSPWYAVAYGANDVVLIILWVMATLSELRYLPMIFCFVIFLVNDAYGFYSWKRRKKKQSGLV